jgi:hypothetical protein
MEWLTSNSNPEMDDLQDIPWSEDMLCVFHILCLIAFLCSKLYVEVLLRVIAFECCCFCTYVLPFHICVPYEGSAFPLSQWNSVSAFSIQIIYVESHSLQQFDCHCTNTSCQMEWKLDSQFLHLCF